MLLLFHPGLYVQAVLASPYICHMKFSRFRLKPSYTTCITKKTKTQMCVYLIEFFFFMTNF